MRLDEVETRLEAIGSTRGSAFLFELLAAYGIPSASISRLRTGTYDKGRDETEHLWKGKVWFRSTHLSAAQLYALIDDVKTDDRVQRERPRFLIATNDERLLAIDTKTGGTLDILRSQVAANASFFLPWAGVEKTQLENVSVADIKAAEKMARLYDEITRHNSIDTDEKAHELNVFFSRLLFCFFAEDTGVFEPGVFTNGVGSLTSEDGSDMPAFFDRLFELLDTPVDNRGEVPAALRDFGYVNGNLFRYRHSSPRFSPKARAVILECGTLDWSQINPDIFGSMMQAVVTPGQREGLGMHYTSVENILKVIRPLFLDELEEALATAGTVRKLENLRKRIAGIQVFDPACGSGNFLVIAYKELRRIEHEILVRIRELEPHRATLFAQSDIDLENFYGIEIDDFAHEIAILSLWLAKHQMNLEFKALFGSEIPLIPLVEAGSVTCGNAARLNWLELVPAGETYLLSNPPYQGGTKQSLEQKQDLPLAFEDTSVNRYLDYVAIWMIKGARFVSRRDAKLGLLTTSSIYQGKQVSLLWPRVLAEDVDISFAHEPFRWGNAAKRNAGVICAIVGLARTGSAGRKPFYTSAGRYDASSINPYLIPDGSTVIVEERRLPLAPLPAMVFGSMPRDGGHLILSPREADDLVELHPGAARFLRRYGGAEEAINGNWRRCLWILDEERDLAARIPPIAERLRRVADERRASRADSTRKYAELPHRFVQRAHQDGASIVVPSVSSERRDYIPLAFLDGGTVISNAAQAVYGAAPWLFGLLHSRMHMAWVRAVGGRLKSDYRYSTALVYNTFPVPALSDADRSEITRSTIAVLAAREQFSDRTLAELYDPEKMPGGLREAHTVLDETIDQLYSRSGFTSDAERLRALFEMYENAIAKEVGPG